MKQGDINPSYPGALQQSQDKKNFLLAPPALLVSIRSWHEHWHVNCTSSKHPSLHFPFPSRITSLLQKANQRQTNSSVCKLILSLTLLKNTSNRSDTSSSGTHCSLPTLLSVPFTRHKPNLPLAHLVLSSKSKVSSFLKKKKKSHKSQVSKPQSHSERDTKSLLLRWRRTGRSTSGFIQGSRNSSQVH